ncbi:MAG: DUF4348 domain-containing protein [Prevotella sp.]|nr:DUF4348 domain-containing protein [Prevotella sp.]
MRKGIYAVLAMCAGMILFAESCKEKKPATEEAPAAAPADSDTLFVADTLAQIIEEQPVPKAADELFDDFIYVFCHNRKHQLSRIQWPLKEMTAGKVKVVQRKQWYMEQLYMPQGFCTLILDNYKQQEQAKDTAVSHVVVEKIFLDKNVVRSFHFNRMEGQWMLTSVENSVMGSNPNGSFLTFYEKFSTDSAFQAESLAETIAFSGPNPDDDSEELQGEITPAQWEDFQPGELPQGVIYNTVYGERGKAGHQKIFLLRGIASGQEMQLTFKQMDGAWKLVGLKE